MKKPLMAALLLAVAIAGGQNVGPALDSVYHYYVTQECDQAREILERLTPTARNANSRFLLMLETGDFYLDKLGDYPAAESVYALILEQFPRDRRRPDVMYRLALAQELQEKYLESAKNYEQVATRYMKSTYGEDALDAIERCFRKNYQERVAYVNGFPITRIELDDRISRNPALYEAFERKQLLLDTMIHTRLLYEAAIDARIDTEPSFRTRFSEMRNRAVFEEWYNEEVTTKAEPTEKQLQARYRRDKTSRYTTPEKVHGYQIVVPDRTKADSLRRALLADTALVWDSVAREHSTAPDKERGGDMGLFARGVYTKALEAAAFKLKPGQISHPVKTDEGYVLLKVTEKKPKEVRPYDQARNQILVQLRQENLNQLYEQKTEELKRKTRLFVDTTAIEEGKDTLAVVDGIVVDQQALQARLNDIPPFYRGQFETPEGKRRILDQLILEKLILKDAEAKKTWLRNKVVDRVLERGDRMLVDAYRGRMTAEKVAVDSAALASQYKKKTDEFKVPAQVHAREIVAKTWTRASQLRRWAVAGRIPPMIAGRALLLSGAEIEPEARLAMAGESIDSLVGAHGLADPPAALPGTPVIRLGMANVPDLSIRCELAGPFRAAGWHGLAFENLSREDKLYLPELETAATPEDLARLLDQELETDSAGQPLVDSARYGVYVRLDQQLPASYVNSLFTVKLNEVARPHPTEDGILLVRVVTKDTTQDISFADLAKRFSTAGTRWSGGDIQWLRRDDSGRSQKVVSTAFGLGEGRISEVLKLDDSTYTFIKVEEKKEAYTRPFDEVRAKLEGELRRTKEADLYAQLIQDLTDNAEIEVLMQESDFIFEFEEEPEPEETPAPPEEELAPEEKE